MYTGSAFAHRGAYPRVAGDATHVRVALGRRTGLHGHVDVLAGSALNSDVLRVALEPQHVEPQQPRSLFARFVRWARDSTVARLRPQAPAHVVLAQWLQLISVLASLAYLVYRIVHVRRRRRELDWVDIAMMRRFDARLPRHHQHT